MRKFIHQLILFTCAPALYFVGTGTFNYYVSTQTPAAVAPARILVAGDSHLQCAIDPEVVPGSRNVSQSSEPYAITYWKLKKIFASWQPDTVLLTLSPHNVSSWSDDIFNLPGVAEEMFRRSYPVVEYEELYRDFAVSNAAVGKALTTRLLKYPSGRHAYYIGEFAEKDSIRSTDPNPIIARHFYRDSTLLATSTKMIGYLDSIIALCNERGVTPIVVSTPLREAYQEQVPGNMHAAHVRKLSHLRRQGVRVINTTNQYYPDFLYYDADHLNTAGARLYTLSLFDRLRAGGQGTPP